MEVDVLNTIMWLIRVLEREEKENEEEEVFEEKLR